MKSKNFTSRAQDANLRGLREKKPAKQTNWDRIVYLVFLCIVVLAILYFAISRYVFVTGNGYLVTKKMEVRAPEDIKILDFQVSPGEVIDEQEALFTYALSYNLRAKDSLKKALSQKYSLNDDLDELKNEIYLLRQELEALKNKRAFYQNRATRIEKEVKLNVSTINELFEAQRDVEELKSKIAGLQAELRVLYGDRSRLKKNIETENNSGLLVSNSEPQKYTSPSTGKIQEIFVNQNELVFESEKIMTISFENADRFIRAIFDRDDASHLMPGTILNIDFDNGEDSKGIVREIYAARANFDYLEYDSGYDLDKKIVVELVPYDKNAKKQWETLGRMSATVQTTIF